MSAPQARPANQVPPPPRGSPGGAAIGPLFLSHFGARAAESLVSQTLSLCVCYFQGSLLCQLLRAFTRRLRLGKGCAHGAHLLGVLLWLFVRLRFFSDATGYPEKLGPDPVFLSGRRQRGTGAVLPPVLSSTHSSCKRGFFPLDLFVSFFLVCA